MSTVTDHPIFRQKVKGIANMTFGVYPVAGPHQEARVDVDDAGVVRVNLLRGRTPVIDREVTREKWAEEIERTRASAQIGGVLILLGYPLEHETSAASGAAGLLAEIERTGYEVSGTRAQYEKKLAASREKTEADRERAAKRKGEEKAARLAEVLAWMESVTTAEIAEKLLGLPEFGPGEGRTAREMLSGRAVR